MIITARSIIPFIESCYLLPASFFFGFLPIALILFRISLYFDKNQQFGTIPRLTLLGLTLIFYGIQETWWLIPLFVCISFDFWWAFLLSRSKSHSLRKLIVTASVIQNVGLLAIFKYWNFLIENLGQVSPSLAAVLPQLSQSIGTLDQDTVLPLPPGISFYIFESLSFVIDIYRKEVKSPKNPLEFFAFICMFPRFIAGPIVRYKQVLNQFHNYSGMKLEKGLFLFLLGLGLKCIFADSFAPFVGYAFDTENEISTLSAWLGALAYTFQIYFDFSGYSLMAIGLGLCLGFRFPINFNKPYLASSIQDFWKRWHISLSTWLRDYLYISLGGNRRGRLSTYRNLFLTMLIGGIWHGSTWVFALWGAWHGLALIIEKQFKSSIQLPTTLNRLYTIFIVVIGWVLFRSTNLEEATSVISSMFNFWSDSPQFNLEGILVRPVEATFCLLSLVYCFYIEPKINWNELIDAPLLDRRKIGFSLAFGILAICIAFSTQNLPFLYFQF